MRGRAGGEGLEFFEKSVRPVLVERCSTCHGGPSPKGKSKGGLNLTTRAGLLAGGDSGPAAVAGKPEESLLVRAIRYHDEPRMPPKKRLGRPRSRSRDGSRWACHGPPGERPEGANTATESREPIVLGHPATAPRALVVPAGRRRMPPAVRTGRLAASRRSTGSSLPELEEKQVWPPSALADRRTLIRRATFDLTGLPPTPEEIEAFLADESPGRLREGRRSAARLARTTASAGAGTGSTWSATPTPPARLPTIPVPEALSLSRLGDRRLQPRHAVRPVRPRADRRRPAGGRRPARARRRADHRHRASWRSPGGSASTPQNYHHLTIEDTIDTLGKAFLGLTHRAAPAATTTSSTRSRRPTTTPCTASSPARGTPSPARRSETAADFVPSARRDEARDRVELRAAKSARRLGR